MSDLEGRLDQIVRASPTLMRVLRGVREVGPPQWLLFSGGVYQTVWNAVTGRDPDYGLKDYDVGYFDPDTSWDAEDVWIKRVADAFDEPLKFQVELRNQARVHLWFEDRFGEPYSPLASTGEALERFVCPAFSVGIRLEPDDRLTIAAPFGLDDVFGMVLRPNPNRPLAKGWERVTASAKARWPECQVVERAWSRA
ncbi:nucleotidyltransferase family protein [Brevundimonas sp. 2R-24]|uniref:Nucleotidyltransferase family protein n=1 Tax=Peiella sedimenti TaxID=3061083 RepID=A0ABT8SLZ4_9CAUL|nr:nucleotidyltransferase family protein [Caulobacteraceae bacterium XZ-24]